MQRDRIGTRDRGQGVRSVEKLRFNPTPSGGGGCCRRANPTTRLAGQKLRIFVLLGPCLTPQAPETKAATTSRTTLLEDKTHVQNNTERLWRQINLLEGSYLASGS
jgi:hypothetical protein